MDKLLVFLLFPFMLSAQEIYKTDKFGVQEIVPSKVIEKDRKDFNIYSYDMFGVKNILPTEVIKRVDSTTYKVYTINSFGVQSIVPNAVITTKNIDRMFENFEYYGERKK